MTQRLGYVPALDGLRAIAIAAVIGTHYFAIPRAGGTGVDLFFVLSGFLITTLLLEERHETGRIRLAGFYARRARRLLPALAVMLAAYLVWTLGAGLRQVVLAGFYYGNFVRAFSHPDPLLSQPLGHLWSLAAEEQFYLVWPLLLALLLKLRRHLPTALSLLLVAMLCWRGWLLTHGATIARVHYSPDAHSDGLAAGALLAVIRARWQLRVPEPAVIAALFVMLMTMLAGAPTPIWEGAGLPIFELAACVLIAAAVTGTPLAIALSAQPLVWIGKISYSLYLWHLPILWAFNGRGWPVAVGISIAVSWASYRFVEQPLRRRRRVIPETMAERPSPAPGA